MNNEIDYYNNLAKIMMTTRGARFTAASNLVLIERCSIATLAFLSVFLIGVSVVSISFSDSIDTYATRYFGLISVIASVCILVITLFDYALGRSVKAEQLTQNALQITALAREMERELATAAPDVKKLREIAEKYEQENIRTQINHATSDYIMHIHSVNTPKNVLERALFPVRTFCYRIFVFSISMPLNILVVIAITCSVWWYFVFLNS